MGVEPPVVEPPVELIEEHRLDDGPR
jgi:hypothetical protein